MKPLEVECLEQLEEYVKRFGGHLGTGWTCRAQVRDSGTRAGSIDTWFTSPTGQVYRSKIAAARGLGLDPSRSKSAQPEPRKEKPLEDITPDNQRVLRRKDTLLKSKSKKSTKTDVKGVVENVLKGQGGNVVPQVVNLSLNEMGELLMSMANAVDLEDCYDGLLFYKEEQMRYEAKLANRRYYEEILAEQLSMQQMAKEELDGYIDGDEKLLDVEQGVPAVGPHQVPDDNGASDSQYSEQQRLFDGHSPKVQRPSESDGAEQGEEETNMIKLDDGRLVRRSARNNSSSKSKTWGEDMHGAKTGFQDVVEAMEALEAMDNEGELQPPGPPCFDGWETEVELIRKCLVRVPARLGRPAAEDPPPLSPRTRDPCVIDALLSLSDGDGDGDADGDGDFINQDALAQSPQKCAPWVQKGFPIAQLSANGGHPTSLHPATLFYLRNLREQQEAEERAAAKWAKEKAERREAKKLEKMAVKEGSALGATPVSNHPSSDVASGKPSSRPTFGERLRGKSMQDIESALMERLRSYVSGLGGILPGGWTVKAAIRQHGANAGGIDAYYFDPAGIKYKSMIKVAESLGLNCANATKAKSVAAVLKSSGQRSHQKVDEKIAYQIAYTTGANPTIPDTDSTPVFPAADTLWQDTKNDPPAVHDAVVKETSSGIDTPGIRNTPGSIKDGNADGAPAPGAQRKRPRKSSTSSDKTKNKGANTDANNHGTENDKRTGDDSGQHHERKSSGNRIGVGNDNNHEDDDDDKKRRKIAASGPGAHKEDHPQPSKKSKKSHAGQSNVDDGKQTNNPKQKTVVKAEAMEEDDKKIKKQDEGKQAKSASDIKRPRKKERGQTETETKPIIKTVYTQALSRLQGQMKRMRQEQALVEAYAADGWRGASREKVKPVAEIRRAKEQINRCKEVIRDCVRVCDEAEGDKKIPAELYDEDGELELDDIFCAKCLENHASDDNDIILCDGDCDRAYHVKCLNPPLDVSALSEDEGWLCPACDTKIDLIDLINEEFGTEYEYNVPWHQILVADTLPPSPRLAANQGGVTIPQTIDLGRLEGLLEGADLPSEDDEDEDYKMSSSGESESQNSGKKGKLNDMEGDIEGGKREDSGDSKDSVSLVSEDGPNEPSDADDDMRAFAERYAKLKELDDGAMERHGAHLIVNGKRQRSKVDYVALSKDMFGNLPSPSLNEDEEDKEWIPKFIGNRNQQTDQN